MSAALASIARLSRAVVNGSPDANFPGISEYFWGQPFQVDQRELDYSQAAGLVDTLYACLTRISQDFAALPVRFYERRGAKWVELDDMHDLPAFWANGNPEQTDYEIARDWIAGTDTTGRSFLFLERGPSGKAKPFEYWNVPGHLLFPVPSAHRRVTEYQDRRNPGKNYPASSVIPLNHWNPNFNPIEPAPAGLSPLSAAQQAYELLWNASRWSNVFFGENGGTVAMMLKPTDKDRRLTEQDAKAIREQFAQQTRENRRKGKPIVLNGLEPTRTGLTMQEMDFAGMTGRADLSVCRVLQVPPVLIGIKDGGGLSDAGATTDLLLYAMNCLGPRATMASRVLTKRLCPLFGPNFACEIDLDGVLAIQNAKLDQAKSMQALTGVPILSPDEARTALDYDPLPNGTGKTTWVPFNVIPADQALNPPPAPEPASSAPSKDAQPSQGSGAQARRLVASGDPKAQMRRMRDADLGRYERRVAAWARGRFGAQEAIALDRLSAQAEDHGAQVSAAARVTRLAYRPDELVDPGEGADEAQRLYDEIILERGEAAAAEVAAEVALRVHQGRLAEIIHHRAAQMVTQIDQTTKERLARAIADAVGSDGGFNDIAQAVRGVFTDRRANAATIARTETAWAYNLASKEAWGEAGVRFKSWLTVGDDAVRDSHSMAEGDGVIPMDQPFSNGLMFPGDPNGPPDETINCRCILQPEMVAESDLARMFNRNGHSNGGGRLLASFFAGVAK